MKLVQSYKFLRTFKILNVLCLLVLISCSDKKNQAPPAPIQNQPGPGVPAPVDPALGNIQNQIGQIFQAIPCIQGGQRISVNFHMPGPNPIGEFQPNHMNSATAASYVGKSVFGDIMVIHKLGTTSSVQGYNASFHMCPYAGQSSYSGQVPLITPQRQITRMKILAPGENGAGMTTFSLATSKACSIDQVTVAEVKMEVAPFQNYPAAPIVTTFFPINFGSNYQPSYMMGVTSMPYSPVPVSTMPIGGICQ